MYLGFCVSVLVFSVLTFVQHANAIGNRRGGSSGHTRNGKLDFPSAFESFAQNGGFLGSSRSSHSAGGQVDRYRPEGSVSSYGSRWRDVRKPTHNSQQPRRTNSNAKGVIQTKAGKWDFASAQNGKRFESGIASSGEIVMQAGPPPPSEPQPSVYQPQQSGYGYQSPSVYQSPQPHHQSPSGYHPGYQSNPKVEIPFSPFRGGSARSMLPTNLMTVPSRTREIPSRYRPRWQQSLVPE